jgi:UDP-N-acetylmuramoyl-L-alanyl-D-glutamate--2,6-diaminopimelate ligase
LKLSDLLDGLDHVVIDGEPRETEITGGLQFDTRAVQSGSLFIAVTGRNADGHDYLVQAHTAGAIAALVEKADTPYPDGMAVIQVKTTRSAAAQVAARFFGDPSRELTAVAVTGTNGKTSVAGMLESILESADQKVGLIGTGGPRLSRESIPIPTTTTTTPEATDLQAILRYMADRATDTVVMEASSTALMQHRTDACDIDVGIFTNLTPDHLEDHGTMQAYQSAKMRLFDGQCRHAIANADDPVSQVVRRLMPQATTTFSCGGEADFSAADIAVDADGTSFVLHYAGATHQCRIPIPGQYAVSNALAATAAAVNIGVPLQEAISALSNLPQIPGRFETFRAHTGATVIVDYAHSEDSLDNVLRTIRGFARGRVITVFGCGGDRDNTKRAPMGSVAGRLSDFVVITNDNARGEDPDAILDQIETGLIPTTTPFARIPDRHEAIAQALSRASQSDVVLVAGKGAETTQLIAREHRPFSDMSVVRQLDEQAVQA